MLYDPEKKEPALPAAPAVGNAGDSAATGSDETLAAGPAATSGDNGDNGDSNNNGDNDMRKASANSGVKRSRAAAAAAVADEDMGRRAIRTARAPPSNTDASNGATAAAAAAALRLDKVVFAVLSGSIVSRELGLVKRATAVLAMSTPRSSSSSSSRRPLPLQGRVPWELGVLLTVMEQAPATAATVYAVSAASPFVEAGVWRRVRRALVLKAVLDFLDFWGAEAGGLKTTMLTPASYTRPLVSVAAAARRGLRGHAATRQGAVGLTGVQRPVQVGLWYDLQPAELLRDVTLPDEAMCGGSAVSSLHLHWPHEKAMTYSEGFDVVATALDIVWWAMLILPLLQRELSDWPSGDDDDDNYGYTDDYDDDDDYNGGRDGGDGINGDSCDSTTLRGGRAVPHAGPPQAFYASIAGCSWKARADAKAPLQQLALILSGYAGDDDAGPQLLPGLLLTEPLLRLLFQRQQRVSGHALVKLLLDSARPWRGSMLRMATA